MDSQNIFTNEEIRDIFEKDILETLGAKDMSDEQKADLYEKMSQTVIDRTIMRIDAMLDETGRKEWITLLEEGDQQKLNDFAKNHNIDPAKLMVEEAMIYKMELASMMRLSKQN